MSDARSLAVKILEELTLTPTGNFKQDANSWAVQSKTTEEFAAIIERHITAALDAERAKVWEEAAVYAQQCETAEKDYVSGDTGIQRGSIMAFHKIVAWCRRQGGA